MGVSWLYSLVVNINGISHQKDHLKFKMIMQVFLSGMDMSAVF